MLAATGAVAYALANFIHETLGHGGACLAMGGALMNLVASLGFFFAMRRARTGPLRHLLTARRVRLRRSRGPYR